MKVLVVINYLKSSMEMTLKPLVQCGKVDKIYVVHDREVPQLPKVEYHSTPKYLYSFLPGILQGMARNFMMLLVMLRLAISKRPDIVISFNIAHSPLAFICGRLFRKPAVAYIDDAPREWRLRRMFVPMLKRCDVVMVTGTRNRKEIIGMGLNQHKVHILPNSIDMDKFKPTPIPRLYDIISVARLAPAKKLDTLLTVISKIKEHKGDIKSVIVGDGPLRVSLQRLASELGIVENVDFLGFRENTEFYYNSSKVFVLTSYYEGLPMAMLEAMACDIPCVVSNVGDVTDIAENELNAIVINDPSNVDAFASAILRLLNDKELYNKISRNTRIVRERYNYRAATTVWDGILDSIAESASLPSGER